MVDYNKQLYSFLTLINNAIFKGRPDLKQNIKQIDQYFNNNVNYTY